MKIVLWLLTWQQCSPRTDGSLSQYSHSPKLQRTKVLSYNSSRNWLLMIELYKYESLCITLNWNNAPSVSYCGPFFSDSKACSTIDHPRHFTKLLVQCSKRIASMWFCIAHVSFISSIIRRISQCWYYPESALLGRYQKPIWLSLPSLHLGLELSSYPTVQRHWWCLAVSINNQSIMLHTRY